MRRGKLEDQLSVSLSKLIKRLDATDTPEERSKVIEEIRELEDKYYEWLWSVDDS